MTSMLSAGNTRGVAHFIKATMSVFYRDSIKGVKALIASGTVEKSPAAIAAFLREHNPSLDKEQLGEYLGHHDELEVCLSLLHSQVTCPHVF